MIHKRKVGDEKKLRRQRRDMKIEKKITWTRSLES